VPSSRFLTLKEIASLLELSPDTIRRRSRELGLDQCRDKLSRRPIRFFKLAALEALRSRGLAQ
jgi:hypothetical protein